MKGSQYESLRDAGLVSDSATEKQVEAINSLGQVEFQVLYNALHTVKEVMVDFGDIKPNFIL